MELATYLKSSRLYFTTAQATVYAKGIPENKLVIITSGKKQPNKHLFETKCVKDTGVQTLISG